MSRELITSWNDYLAAAERLCGLARQSILIYDEDLRSLKLESPGRVALLGEFLSQASGISLQIALRDGSSFQNHSPRLQQLLNTWQHKCEIRKSPEHLGHLRDNLLIVDRTNALIRLDKDMARSVLLLDEESSVHPYKSRFDEIWLECDENLLHTPLGL